MAAKSNCPSCGSGKVKVEKPKEYTYKHCGISGIKLVGNGVTITHCDECKNTTTSIWNEQQLSQVLGLFLLLSPPGMRGEHLRYLRNLYGMTQAELAHELNRERRETIADWEGKDRIFNSPAGEIVPRIILLNLFKDKVIDSDYCFLEELHKKVYDKFVCSFVPRVGEEIHRRPQKNVPLKIRRRAADNVWSSTNNFALAG